MWPTITGLNCETGDGRNKFPFKIMTLKIDCILYFIVKSVTGSSIFLIPSEWTLAKTALHNIASAAQPRKNDPQSAAAAAAWARCSNPLLCRRAMSMPPLRPPRPSLTDSPSQQERCISTGEPRRYTAREVSLKKSIQMKSLLARGSLRRLIHDP